MAAIRFDFMLLCLAIILPSGTKQSSGAPGVPTNVKVADISGSSVNVTWDKPTEGANLVKGYNVKYDQLPPSNSHEKYVTSEHLLLSGLKPFTQYNISIQAESNVTGAWSATVFRTAETAPSGSPTNLLVKSVNFVALNVSWKEIPAAQRNGLIKHYMVEYRKRWSSIVKTETVSEDKLSIKLKNLDPGTYDVRVAGRTSVGTGPMTGWKSAEAKEGVPSAAPTNLVVQSKAALSLHILWQEIPLVNRNGKIVRYRVYYKKSGSARYALFKDVLPPKLELTLDSLDYGTYDVKLKGYTQIGFGPETPPQTATTNEGAPTKPQNVEVQAMSSKKIKVTWQHPQTANGKVMRYIIRYGTQKDSLNQRVQLGSAHSSYTLDNLEEFTTYYIQVRAETSVTGTPSGMHEAKTLEDAPSSSPVINTQTSKANDAHSIYVDWSEIPEQNRNGKIKGYRVMYKASDEATTKMLNVSYVNTDKTITGLRTFTSYCIKVVGYTDVGDSPPGSCTYIKTGDKGPSAPRNVSVKVESSTSVALRWIEPEHENGDLQGYEIIFKMVDGGREVVDKVTSLTFKFTATNLRKFTKYSFAVRGKTSQSGNSSTPIVVTTFEDAPSAPVDLLVDKSTDTTVQLKWKEPREPNGRIRSYNIRAFDSRTGNQLGQLVGVHVSCSHGTCSQLVSSLKPYRNITLMVQAVTIKPGDSSNCTARTQEGAPSAPMNVRVSLERDNIKVTWAEPAEHNGIIRNYTVYYKGERAYDPSFKDEHKKTVSVSQSRQVQIKDLRPGTNYAVQVAGATHRKEGAKSEAKVVRTPAKEPVRPEEPTNIKTGTTTVAISLTPCDPTNGELIAHQLIVEKLLGRLKRSSDSHLPEDIAGFKKAKEEGSRFYIAATFKKSEVPNPFTVGNGKVYNGYYNAPLEPVTKYRIHFRGVSQGPDGMLYGEASSKSLPATAKEVVPAQNGGSTVGMLAGIVGALVLIIIVVVAVILYRRSTRLPSANVDVENQKAKVKRKRREMELKRLMGKKRSISKPSDVTDDPGHPPISADNFAKHVNKLHKSDDRGFMIEYNKLDDGSAYPAEVGLLPENKAKNRYTNIVAYDHSRVLLSSIEGVDGSDYINASLVDGHNKPNAYIATQGPVPPTFPDFWRMVWEQQSSTIVMLTNLQERHKLKCHKYWPDQSEEYGDITVTLVKSEPYADYVIRTLTVKRECEKEEREVKQFHFTVWPDHGVPEYPTALLAFRRRVRAYNPADAGPLTVHCSAGVGRTGTFIVVDSMLDRLASEGTLDIYNCVAHLRSRRIFMVQTEEQYTFCHDAILEAHQSGNTQILAHDLRINLSRMDDLDEKSKSTRFESQFKTLNKVSPVLSKGCFNVASYPENKGKNRFPDILASDYTRVMLTAIDDNEITTYINAVHIAGYKQQQAFMVTQYPLASTVADFWRMLCEQESCSVVLFRSSEDEDLPAFWPESGTESFDDMITVDCLTNSSASVDNLKNDYDQSLVRESQFKMTDLRTPEKQLRAKFFYFAGWEDEKKPPACSSMISLIAKVEQWQQRSGNGPITVVCRDGLGRSGTFCALYSVLERVKVEQVVDVFQAIKAMRISRPGLVKTAEEYRLIHFAVQEYLTAFDDYANFK